MIRFVVVVAVVVLLNVVVGLPSDEPATGPNNEGARADPSPSPDVQATDKPDVNLSELMKTLSMAVIKGLSESVGASATGASDKQPPRDGDTSSPGTAVPESGQDPADMVSLMKELLNNLGPIKAKVFVASGDLPATGTNDNQARNDDTNSSPGPQSDQENVNTNSLPPGVNTDVICELLKRMGVPFDKAMVDRIDLSGIATGDTEAIAQQMLAAVMSSMGVGSTGPSENQPRRNEETPRSGPQVNASGNDDANRKGSPPRCTGQCGPQLFQDLLKQLGIPVKKVDVESGDVSAMSEMSSLLKQVSMTFCKATAKRESQMKPKTSPQTAAEPEADLPDNNDRANMSSKNVEEPSQPGTQPGSELPKDSDPSVQIFNIDMSSPMIRDALLENFMKMMNKGKDNAEEK